MDWSILYINPPYLFGGLMGGLVHVFWVKKKTPWEIVGYLVTGALAANYFAPQLFYIIAKVPPEAISFVVGMAGRPICYLAEKFMINRANSIGKTKNE